MPFARRDQLARTEFCSQQCAQFLPTIQIHRRRLATAILKKIIYMIYDMFHVKRSLNCSEHRSNLDYKDSKLISMIVGML
jgi:hypothetical protein